MTTPGSSDDVERLAELARRTARHGLGSARRRIVRASFLERAQLINAEAQRGVRVRFWALPGLATALALAIWVFSSRQLTFEVEGGSREGSYVRAPGDRAAIVRFSDDTVVRAEPTARLRVEHAGANRTRILVERGKANVHVLHDATRAWTFVAGPFEVRVTGTRFTLDWEPVQEKFELSLTEGSVEIRGPKGAGPVALQAGQRFQGDGLRGSMLVDDAGQPSPPEQVASQAASTAELSTSTPAPSALVPPELRKTRLDAPAGEPRKRPIQGAPESWQRRIARGDFVGIVEDAERRGVGQCLTSCSAADLRALSDAARYAGQTELARQSLLALRDRFGKSGGDAAFLLGRLEEQRGSSTAAERWYDVYLRETPAGSFAAEALAGKMRVVNRLRGLGAARPVARDYLERFPRGVHITKAREILGEK